MIKLLDSFIDQRFCLQAVNYEQVHAKKYVQDAQLRTILSYLYVLHFYCHPLIFLSSKITDERLTGYEKKKTKG